MYIVDQSNHRIRKVSPGGIISTIAGNGTGGYSGDGGAATAGELFYPTGVATDGSGNVYIADYDNERVRKVTTGAPAVAAISGPTTVATGSTITLTDATSGGTWSSSSTATATVSSGGVVTGVAPGSVVISYAVSNSCGTSVATYGVTVTSSSSSACNIITTIVGNGTAGATGDGGAATSAEINTTDGFAIDASGNMYISDYTDNRIRKVSASGTISTFAGTGTSGFSGDGGAATSANLHAPAGIDIDASGNVYFADGSNNRIRKVTPSGIISTFAGTGASGFGGDGGPATAAVFQNPYSLKFDVSGNLYIGDGSNRIRKINTSGIISTIAGTGTGGFTGDGGAATAAELYAVANMIFDAAGNLYFADEANSRIRKITTAGIINTVAGNGTSGYSGDGGAATSAELMQPSGVVLDGTGNLYIADQGNNRVRMVNASGIISTYAGNGTGGFSGDGGAATAAELFGPAIIVLDPAGNLCVADYGNYRIRKIAPGTPAVAAISGATTVAAGSTITLTDATSGGTWSSSSTATATVSSGGVVSGVAAGTVFITYSVSNSCGTNAAIYAVTVTSSSSSTCNIITTIAGTGTSGFTGDGGAATAAELNQPYAVVIDGSGNVYISDELNQRIRKVTAAGIISTIAGNGTAGFSGDGGPATAAEINDVAGLALDIAGNLYLSDGLNRRIRKINTSGVITTVAGNGTGGYTGDGGAATAAEISPNGLAVDWAGNIYIAEPGNARVRKVNTSGIISTVAGSGSSGFSGDGGAATAAVLNSPMNVAVDGANNFYIADAGNNRIRKVNSAGVISTIAGNGTAAYAGDGGAATAAELNYPIAVAVDPANNVYISDYSNFRIREVSPSGIISTIAGNGTGGTTGDGGPATAAEVSTPAGIAIDNLGNVYFPSQGGMRVRKITTGSVSVAAISGASTVASGSSITLTDATSGGSWTSGNTSIATVSSTGSVTGVAVGSAVITYAVTNSCGTAVAAFEVTVTSSSSTSCNVITTYAGNGTGAYAGDGGTATAAEINNPNGMCYDASGNLYVADEGNARIRKITPAGVVSTYAGNGTTGFTGDGGAATAAELTGPTGVAFDASGNLYILDGGTSHVRKVTPAGIISTVAGSGISGYTGDGGAATAARIFCPNGGVAIDPSGNLYIADNSNNRIRKVSTSGIITTFAGNGTSGYSGDGGAATAAELAGPRYILFDAAGNLYISDYGNNRIRKVTPSGIISTFAGNGTSGYTGDGGAATAAEINAPRGIYLDGGANFYISDFGNYRVRKINSSGIISTIAGNGTSGYAGDGGNATAAELADPEGIVTDASGTVYIADGTNNRIRKINPGTAVLGAVTGPATVAAGSSITLSDTTSGGSWSSSSTSIATVNSSGVVTGVAAGSVTISYSATNSCGTSVVTYGVTVTTTSCSVIITTIAGTGTGTYSGDGGAATAAGLHSLGGLFFDGSGNMYITDAGNNRIRKVTAAGVISTVAGNGTAGYSGDGGAATAAELNSPSDVKIDGSGNMYITDYLNSRVRKVTPAGIISTVVGNGTSGFSGDGGAATAAEIYYPQEIVFDGSGNYYIADEGNGRVRKVSTSGIITTVAGGGSTLGDGGPATAANISHPGGVVFDISGNMYVSDMQNYRIRKITTAGIISTIAGNGTAGYSGDGGAATAAELDYPTRLCFDGAGNLYVPDYTNNRLREVSTSGIITTIAGNGTGAFAGDGGSPTASELYSPDAVCIDGSGNIYISDAFNNRVRKITTGAPVVAAIAGPSTVAVGSTITLTDATSGGTWSSSATGTATVSSGGVVTGVAAGVATITYSVTNSCGTSVQTYGVSVTTASCSAIITTIAGNGTAGYTGDGGAATAAEINRTNAIVQDAAGNFYFSDAYNNRIRKISTSGIISTIAGTGTGGYSGDGGPATAANLNQPSSLAFDGYGNLYIGDLLNNRIRKINLTGVISLVAGNGTAGYSGDGGAATAAALDDPYGLVFDATGNLYFADELNSRIRKINISTGVISTFAGNGTGGYSGDGGAATSAAIFDPNGLAIDLVGNIYLNDNSNHRIRKVSTAGIITTYAGNGTAGFSGDGGPATAAEINWGSALQFDASGNLYYADGNNNRIRVINSSGIISTFAGNGTLGFSGDGGPATAAELDGPIGFGIDSSGNVLIADMLNYRIRKVTTGAPTVAAISGSATVSTGGTITLTDATSGGSWASSNTSIATVSGGVVGGVAAGTATISYSVSNSCGTTLVTKFITVTSPSSSCNIITTIAGNGTAGFAGDGGAATAAELTTPFDVVVDGSGNVYFTDHGNHRLRKITPAGIISTVAGNGTAGYSGDGGPATAAEINNPYGVAIDGSGNIYIADYYNNRIRKVTPAGIITTVAGNGTLAYAGDGGYATAAELNDPTGVAVDGNGNLYIADFGNSRIRKVNAAGVISTISGNGTAGYSGDGGAATAAEINNPYAVAIDGSGNVIIADYQNNRIRKVTPAGIITTIAGNGTAGFAGDGGAATAAELSSPISIATDAAGNLYISDLVNNRVRYVTPAGIISTFAGNGTGAFAGDGGVATAAELNYPCGVATDAAGNVYIGDNVNQRVRKIISGLPVIGSISGPSAVCAGATITLSDTTSSGTWSSSSTSVATVSSGGIVGGVAGGIDVITYSVANACGSMSVTKIDTVKTSPASAGTISGPTSVCTGANISLTDGTSGGVWTTSSSSIATVNATGTVGGVSTGSVVVSYSVSNSCGSTVATYGVTVGGTPAVAAVGGTPTVCRGASVTLTDGTSGGTWTSASTSIATVNGSGQVTGVAVGTTTITYTVSNTCGSAFTTVSFTVTTTPSAPGPISGLATVCTGSTITLTDTTAGGVWSSSSSSVASVGATGIVTGVTAGTATISYLVSNSCGSVYAIKSITVSGAPSVAAISGTTTLCSSGSTTLTDGTSGGAWTSGNTSVATINSSGTVFGVSTGTAQISYTVTNSCGTTSSVATVTVITVPVVAAISGSSTLCNGTSTTLTDGTSGGTWSSLTTSVATVNTSGTVYGVSAGATTISYSVTNSCGTSVVTKPVTVSASASAGTIAGASTVCSGATTTLSDGTSGGTWTSSNTALATVSASGVVTGIGVGSVVISYTVSSTCGTAVATYAMTVNLTPSAGSITGVASICAGATATMTDAASGGVWSSSAISIATVTAGGGVTGVAAGSVVISYSVTNTCGTAVASHPITINPLPAAGTITGPTTVCIGAAITLADAASGGTWSSSNTSLATVSAAGIVSGVASGTLGISYTVANSCGSSVAGAVVTVSAAPTAGTITGPTTVCTGTTISLSDAVSGGTWSSSSTAKATVNSVGMVTGVSVGTVAISYTVTSACATVVASSTITVSAAATAGTISGLATVCTGASVTLTTSGTAGGAWSSSNAALATVSAGVVHGIAAGTVTISYAVTTGCGTVVATKSVIVNATPTVTAISGATNICIGTTSTYTDGTTGGGWISSSTAIATVNAGGVVTGIGAGSAILTYFVTNTCGTATTTKPITVNTLSAGVIAGAASVAVGASTTLTNTVSGGVWSSLHTGIATVGATGLVTGVAVGTDSIKYSVTNVCGTANAYKMITITAHRDELPGATNSGNDVSINVYPNPNTGTFILELTGPTGEANVIVADLSGRIIEMQTSTEKQMTFDLSKYAAGTYLLKVNVDGNVFSRKVIVN